jgi:flagellar basal body-associated protein FliL
MAEPAPQRSLKRVWIMILVIIVIAWIVYAVTGGPSTPKTETSDSAPTQQR